MNDEEALLAAIKRRPRESEPRQVYADWLEERGDGRCEIVRAHEHLRGLPPNAESHIELTDAWQHLVQAYLEHGADGDGGGKSGRQTHSFTEVNRRKWLREMGIFTGPFATTRTGYAALRGSHPVVACRFYATWSGPCRAFQSIYYEAAKRLAPWCVFLEVDIDTQADWAQESDVNAVPYLIVEHDEQRDTTTGLITLPKLLSHLEEICKKAFAG